MSNLNAVLPGGAELAAGAQVVFIVAESVREAGEIPSGTLYALLAAHVSLDGYQKVLGILTRAGLISVHSHLIRWIGPQVTA